MLRSFRNSLLPEAFLEKLFAPIFPNALNGAVMNTFTRLLAVVFLILCAAGCSSTDEQQQQENPNASSIPWNRPQTWEGQGMLGGFNQGPQGSTGH